MIMLIVILFVAALYLCCGLVFAVFFLIAGIEKTDPAAHGSGWGFRLLILPGTMALWPVLLRKWIHVKND